MGSNEREASILSCFSKILNREKRRISSSPSTSPESSVVIEQEPSSSTSHTTTSYSLTIDKESLSGSRLSSTGSTVLPIGDKKKPIKSHSEKAQKKAAKEWSEKLDKLNAKDWNNERKYVKLLLLGPGEAGKSTLIKQMQLINGANLNEQERRGRIPHIKQNIFDSMVAILVAMKEFNIPLKDQSLGDRAQILLRNSQVCNPDLTSKDILNSKFLQTEEFFEHISHLWKDEGVRQAYHRSHEYQLLDSAAYFFNRIATIRQSDYIPDVQDVLRCRVMTTSITETKFDVPVGNGQVGHFNVLDVGGQRGDRRKWITLFDKVTAVLYVQDISSFDQTLREDSKTNRLLESLKVFYQVVTTKYLRSVSILTFLNKIDILKEKIERGADFRSALEIIKEQALMNSMDTESHSDYDRQIYRKLYDILVDNPYDSFEITETDIQNFAEAFPGPEIDQNHNTVGKKKSHKFLMKKTSNTSLYADVNEEVVKAATYMKLLLIQIKERVEDRHDCRLMFSDTEYRSYEFYYTCAVDKNNITKVMEGCKSIIIKDHLMMWGILNP